MSFSFISVGFVVGRCHFLMSVRVCVHLPDSIFSVRVENISIWMKNLYSYSDNFWILLQILSLMCIYHDNYRLFQFLLWEELQNLHCMKCFFSPLYVPHVKSFHPPTYYMQMDPTVYPPGTQSCFKVVVSRFCTRQIRHILYMLFRISHERFTSQYWSHFAVLFISRCRFTGKFCQD